ncbi:MAG: hypothetical protein PHS04_10960 [Tissierellia bacterium]|nr:hypothetical protein [Tissierellia bacterium]
MNSSLLTGFIKNRFAGKDRKKPFSLKWVFYRGLTKILSLVESIPVEMIHPGIAIQQAEVDLRPELYFCLGLATHGGTYMRLMNAHDAIFYLMALLPVHCLLLFRQIPDDKKIF